MLGSIASLKHSLRRAPTSYHFESQWRLTGGRQHHSCMDLRTGSDLQRSGTGVGPGSESKMGHIRMGTFKQGRTCKGPGPGSDPVPNWNTGVRATMASTYVRFGLSSASCESQHKSPQDIVTTHWSAMLLSSSCDSPVNAVQLLCRWMRVCDCEKTGQASAIC